MPRHHETDTDRGSPVHTGIDPIEPSTSTGRPEEDGNHPQGNQAWWPTSKGEAAKHAKGRLLEHYNERISPRLP